MVKVFIVFLFFLLAGNLWATCDGGKCTDPNDYPAYLDSLNKTLINLNNAKLTLSNQIKIIDIQTYQTQLKIYQTETSITILQKEIIDLAAKIGKLDISLNDLTAIYIKQVNQNYRLKKKIPIRLTDWDTSTIGFLETDLVAHCGSSAFGQFANTVSLTEIASGWWEGKAIMSKGQEATLNALKEMRKRTPFAWQGLDSDNGSEFINYHLLSYCEAEKLYFTRSRENKKNDNAYVEQKNWTHVRKIFGYFRYDTEKELAIINDLYRNELRLYKNFFQPVMKLAQKIRYGAKKHRKYEPAKTPYKRLIESDQIPKKTKDQLKALYETLNPAALKRRIDHKLGLLLQAYQRKRKPIPQQQVKEKEVSSGLGIS